MTTEVLSNDLGMARVAVVGVDGGAASSRAKDDRLTLDVTAVPTARYLPLCLTTWLTSRITTWPGRPRKHRTEPLIQLHRAKAANPDDQADRELDPETKNVPGPLPIRPHGRRTGRAGPAVHELAVGEVELRGVGPPQAGAAGVAVVHTQAVAPAQRGLCRPGRGHDLQAQRPRPCHPGPRLRGDGRWRRGERQKAGRQGGHGETRIAKHVEGAGWRSSSRLETVGEAP